MEPNPADNLSLDQVDCNWRSAARMEGRVPDGYGDGSSVPFEDEAGEIGFVLTFVLRLVVRAVSQRGAYGLLHQRAGS